MQFKQIADNLRRQADSTGHARTVLTSGQRHMAVSYKRIDSQNTLIAGHPGVYPSDAEAVALARAFGVPLGTDPSWQIRHQRTEEGTVQWYTIAWEWMEYPAVQPALIQPATVYA